MSNEKGFIWIPKWFFWLAPVGAVLIAVELVRLFIWLYENVSVTLK